MIGSASDAHAREIWLSTTNPITYIKVVEEALTAYQREELNDDQAHC